MKIVFSVLVTEALTAHVPLITFVTGPVTSL